MYPKFTNYLGQKFELSRDDAAKVSALVKQRKLGQGSFLLQPGEICKHTFFVESGLLRLFSLSENGKEHIIQFAAENWLLSDRDSVFFQEPTSYYIEAIEDSLLIPMDEEIFGKIASLSPDFGKKNEMLLHNHIRHLNKRINLLLSASAKTRYLEFIKSTQISSCGYPSGWWPLIWGLLRKALAGFAGTLPGIPEFTS